MWSKMCVYFFLQSKINKMFLMKTLQDLYPNSELQWTSNWLKVKITVSVQLQRAINDTRQWIGVLSSETIGQFYYFLILSTVKIILLT